MPFTAAALLAPAELQAAAETSVWVVWWEEPEKSWESVCLSPAEAEREYEARQNNSAIQNWGKAGKSDRQTLLEWFEGHLRVVHPSSTDQYAKTAKEAIRKVSAGEAGPVTLRTW